MSHGLPCRWEILKRAREAAERSVALRETLDKKEKEVESLEQELDRVRIFDISQSFKTKEMVIFIHI